MAISLFCEDPHGGSSAHVEQRARKTAAASNGGDAGDGLRSEWRQRG